MKSWLKEPLLHFVILGIAIFALDSAWSGGETRVDDDEIIVSRGRIENLTALYAKTWQRAPTASELRVLVDDFVLEEALYREGKALGVDLDDTIIRRRVRQKMEFVVDDIIERAEPDEAGLEQWLEDHREDYSPPARYRFRQIYLNPELHGEQQEADALKVLAELRALEAGGDPRGHGDPMRFEHAFPDASVHDIELTFGDDFAEAMAALPVGEWSGPIPSAYGAHLVFIDLRTMGEAPALDEVRAEVERDWAYAQREKARKQYRVDVLARYRPVIDWPESMVEAQQP